MRAFAPSTALERSGSATTLSPSEMPGRYLTFSCFSLMTSVSLRPSYCHTKGQRAGQNAAGGVAGEDRSVQGRDRRGRTSSS